MKKLLEVTLQKVLENSCLESTNASIFEVSDVLNSRCTLNFNHTESGHLSVSNPNQKEVNFLAIDQCLFFNYDKIRRCDFALFDDTDFYFVEIKSISGSKGTKRNEAIEQLKTTILYFKEKGIAFEPLKLTAVICFSATYPRSRAMDLDKKLTFEEDCHANLLETNVLAF